MKHSSHATYWRAAAVLLLAAALWPSARCLAAPVPDAPALHVVVVLDKDGKQSYQVVKGTFIPDALLIRTPGYRPKAPPPPPAEPAPPSWSFFQLPPPAPPPPPAPVVFPATNRAEGVKAAAEAAARTPAPVAVKLVKNIGRDRGRRIVLNLLGAGAMMLAALALFRYFLKD